MRIIDPIYSAILESAVRNPKPSSQCNFCKKWYWETKEWDNYFQGIFVNGEKVACCKKCFLKKPRIKK